MYCSVLVFAIAASSAFAAAVPKPNLLSRGAEAVPAVESAGKSGHDADDAIAYAWTVQDKVARAVPAVESAGKSGHDADDAIAYAWTVQDKVARAVQDKASRAVPAVESAGKSGHDADDAIAYAWTVQDKVARAETTAERMARTVDAVVRAIKRECGIVHDDDETHADGHHD